MLTVSELFIYPIKSLGGISVDAAFVTDRGFKYDRCWMLVDANNRFITQREFPELAMLQVTMPEDVLLVQQKHTGNVLKVRPEPQTAELLTVKIWDDTCIARAVSKQADEWFSEILSFSCRLVYMPHTTERKVDTDYAFDNEITAFSDGYPFLLIGQSSLSDLNDRLEEPLPVNRFRPNIVFTGGLPYEEDAMQHFTIQDIDFFGVKLCARCVVTTTDQQTGRKGKEPLKTLSAYRRINNNVYFGQNLLHKGSGIIKPGDILELKKKKALPVFH